jgi:hypothetical protein
MVLLPGCACCGSSCTVSDGRPRSDPKDEGNWVPSGTWASGVTWTFIANPGDDSGETWFFYGSSSTSGSTVTADIRDWGNICNWWSSRNVSPSTGTASNLVKRATRLPPTSAVVHIYSPLDTSRVGPQTVSRCYVWGGGSIVSGAEVTATGTAHDTAGGTVFNAPGAFPLVLEGVINGGAQFNGPNYMSTRGTVNGGAVFRGFSFLGLSGVVNGGATFNDDAGIGENSATVNGGAVFNDRSNSGAGVSNIVNDGATFNGVSSNGTATINDGATFNDSSLNGGDVYGGAVFNDSSVNDFGGTVFGGATFNDAACSRRSTGARTPAPCSKKFVAHPTDLPTCNGTALDGCHVSDPFCGCG